MCRIIYLSIPLCLQVISRIVDGSELHEFKSMYGTTIIAGFTYIHGYIVYSLYHIYQSPSSSSPLSSVTRVCR